MRQLLIVLLWVVLLVAALVAFDQTMVRLSTPSGVLREAQTFYCDFRARVLSLSAKRPEVPQSIEALIEKYDTPPPAPSSPPPKAPAQGSRPQGESPKKVAEGGGGYLYVDEKGELRMAAKLEEVPPRYRSEAKPLKK